MLFDCLEFAGCCCRMRQRVYCASSSFGQRKGTIYFRFCVNEFLCRLHCHWTWHGLNFSMSHLVEFLNLLFIFDAKCAEWIFGLFHDRSYCERDNRREWAGSLNLFCFFDHCTSVSQIRLDSARPLRIRHIWTCKYEYSKHLNDYMYAIVCSQQISVQIIPNQCHCHHYPIKERINGKETHRYATIKM